MTVKLVLALALVLATESLGAHAQVKRVTVPLGDAISKALQKSALDAANVRPFHLRVMISEPENARSPYRGSIEEWWLSPQQWRREVTGPEGMRQTIVVVGGQRSEKDEEDYFPLWLRSFVTAVFDPVPDAAAWTSGGGQIGQIILPDGRRSDACARSKSKAGTGEQATDAFSSVCFDGEGRLKFYGSPRYSMEFHDYKAWGNVQVARNLVDKPEPGTTLVGVVEVLEDAPPASAGNTLFTRLAEEEDRFRTVAVSGEVLEQLAASHPPIAWPAVRSGNLRGHLAMYVSVDPEGHVREPWPLNSDNAGLEEPAREQVRRWKLKPATDKAGKAVQVDGALGFLFETHVDNPLPVLTASAAMGTQVTGCAYGPILPKGLLPSGKSFAIRASVNEAGKLTGETYPQDVPWEAVQKAGLHLDRCSFHPYLVNERPTYYYIDFVFTAP